MINVNSLSQYGITEITPPGVEPVTVDEAIEQLREDSDLAQTDRISMLITAARVLIELYLRRALISTEFTLTLDEFGDLDAVIELPLSRVISVDEIRYVDDSGDVQVLDSADYQVDLISLVCRVAPSYGNQWPSTREQMNAVAIDFTAGYGTAADDVPTPIKQAILFLVEHWYENGEIDEKLPNTAKFLLGPFRVRG